MNLTRVVLWLVLGLVAFLVVSAVVSAIFTLVAIVWTLIRAAVTLAVLGGLAYGAYRLYAWLTGDSATETHGQIGRNRTSASVPGTTEEQSPENRVDDLQQRYAEGKLSESELERELERELATDEQDSIDRELERERR